MMNWSVASGCFKQDLELHQLSLTVIYQIEAMLALQSPLRNWDFGKKSPIKISYENLLK